MSSLLRSTKFVRYFTGAARTLILNSAKTAEVNTLINPKALCAVNNVVLRDYATTKKTETLEPLLQKLDSEVRRFGRITKRDIDEVFDELQGKNDITSSQSLLVIRCCGDLVPEELPEQRTLLVQKIWNVLTERGVPMDISHYNALLRVYLENEHNFSPAQFLEELENKGLQPNRVTYQRLMWRYCQEGDVEGATKVLEKMRELNFPVSEPVLNALVMGHAFHGDTEGAKAVLETMAGAGLQPTNRTYTLLACGYAKKGDIAGIKDVIKIATDKDAYMTDKDILDVIEHLTIGGHGDKVEQLFPYLHKSTGYNQDVRNLILKLLNKGYEETAKKMMKTMHMNANVEDTIFKGAFFIKQLLKLNKSPEDLIKICRDMKEDELIPNSFYIATETALQQGRVELAQVLFKELHKDGLEIRQHYYWPLLIQKGKEGDEEGLLQIIRTMTTQGVPPSGEALRDYVIPYMIGNDTEENIIVKLQLANVPVIHSARNMMIELLDAGNIRKAAKIANLYRPRGQFSLVSRPLLNAFSKTKDIESFVSILHVISSNPQISQNEEDSTKDDVQSDDKVYSNEVGRIVKSAIKNLPNLNLCEPLLKAVYSKGLRISTASAEEIEQHLGQNMTTELSELLAQLTSSDLEPIPLENTRRTYTVRTTAQMEQLLTQIKSKEGTNSNHLRKQLLLAYIKENNVEKVNNFLMELKSSEFEISLQTLAQLYEFYCINDEIEKAKECENQIIAKDPNFQLNRFKIMQMAYALVRAGKLDEAIQFLNERKTNVKDDVKSFMFNSKCWQLLNHVAELKDDVKVKELTKALIDNDYIEPSNVLLGPCIKVHLLKDDIEGALKEFEYCCKNYRTTPWKGELMKALIMKEDATKLQWLADLSTQIHGEVNILHDLVLAFVECGRLRQARRILETPGLLTRQRRLEDACQRYVEDGKSEYLEGLLEATKELSHIDRTNIFYHLLVTYCKANETDKALGLWTLLQEEDEVASDQFLLYLGKHLQSKNREIPFVMPQEKENTHPPKQGQPEKTTVKKERTMITKTDVSQNIENLTSSGKTAQALDVAISSIRNGVIPKPSVLKFLLKSLAEGGDVEKIQMFGKYVNDNTKRNVTYDDKLTLAIINRGDGSKHIDELLQTVTTATTNEELEVILRKFPRSTALATLMDDDTLVKKCHQVAELALAKEIYLPANLLWMEYILLGKKNEANSLWEKGLKNSGIIVFRRLLQQAHVRRQPELIENLINTLKSNKNVTSGSIGNAYSRLVNIYLSEFKTKEALAAFEKAIESGALVSHFNKTTLKKLKTAVETEGDEFRYAID